MKSTLAIVFFGAAFGFVLGWGRIADPDTIYAMLRLWEPDLYLLMGSAIVTGAIGSRLLRRRGTISLIERRPVTWRGAAPSRDHVVGSALFGLGWSVTWACPGPIAVLIGRGELTALFTAAGFMIGIALRDAVRDRRSRPAEPSGELAAPGL